MAFHRIGLDQKTTDCCFVPKVACFQAWVQGQLTATSLVSNLGAAAHQMNVGSARCRKGGAESISFGTASRVARVFVDSIAADCIVDARALACALRLGTAVGSRWTVGVLDADTQFHWEDAAGA